MSDPFFSESFALKLERLLCREEKEKGVVCCSPLHVFGQFGGNGMRELLKIRNKMING